MMGPGWLRHSLQIARVETTRSRRQLGRSSTLRAAIAVVVIVFAVGSGIGAYTFGTLIRDGQATLPLETLHLVATGGFLALLVGFVQQTSNLTERINTDHLLTTVSAHTAVLGVVLAVLYRTIIRIAPTSVCVAVGFAVGTRSPAIALTILVAVAGLFALTALVGVCLSLTVELVTTRSPRFRRYKNVLVALAFMLVVIGWVGVSEELVSAALGLRPDWISAAPTAWFVDLGLLGMAGSDPNVLRSVGALALLAGGIPVFLALTARFAERVWMTEPVSAKRLHRSRPLVGEGFTERLFAGRVSRPVLTVARKRWLQERRVPRAIMMPGYLLVLLLGVLFPILATGEVPGISLVVLVAICAAATGLAFGLAPIETEYSSLPMTLTSVTGEQFVRGTALTGVAIGAPITVVVTLLLAVGSPLGVLEPLLIAVVGVVLCGCSVTLAAAIGMRVSYRDLLPGPLPFSSATIHAEIGTAGFIKMGEMLGLLGLVCLPAVGGYLFAFLGSGTGAAVPIALVRIGSLGLTALLAVGVSILTHRRAVCRFDRYTLL
jgi:ABC-2 type transport system permease protein